VRGDTTDRLPRGWAERRLEDVAEVLLGKMLSPKAQISGLLRRPYLRNDNVRWWEIELDDLREMGFSARELGRYGVEPGDLFVCEGGEPGRCAIYRGPGGKIGYQKALHRVRPFKNSVDVSLLQYWIRHLADSGALIGRIAQTTIQHLPLERFRAVSVPIPPRPEQRRIVAALEEQLSRIDAGVAALERAKANLERYRASVLKAACEGRLVPTEAELSRAEGRSYEPASELLARILKGRRARWEADQLARMKARGKPPKDDSWKKKYPEPAAPDTSALPELPEGWCWASLLAITELKGGLTKGQKRRPGEIVRRVPYLRVANVQRGFLDLTEMKEIEATEQEIAELRLEPGDVLFNEGGDRDKLGRGWIWAGELPLCVHQNHVFRARVIANAVDPRFLSHYGNSFGQAYFLEQGKQTTNLASINLTKLGALPVPIPPRCEQGRIVAEIERALSTATATGSSIHHGLLRSSRLRQSLLAHAFSGKLVPQDPNDEPASVLLERIRKEREVGEAKKPEKSGRRPAPRARRAKPSGAKKA